MREIERKFLVETVPNRLEEVSEVHEIRQGYIIVGDKKELRVRRVGHKSHDEVAVKKGEGVLREEVVIQVSREKSESLWDAVESEIEKTRYIFDILDLNGFPYLAEFDVYGGDLDGLQTVEVEFEEESMNSDEFQPPGWFGREVTENSKFKNKRLASLTYSDLDI